MILYRIDHNHLQEDIEEVIIIIEDLEYLVIINNMNITYDINTVYIHETITF